MPALGADRAKARTLSHEAQIAYNLRQFKDALDKYAAAYRLDPVPELLFNIAQCHRQLKQYEEAVFFYKRYLAISPNSANAENAARLLEEVQRLATGASPAVRLESATPPTDQPTAVAPPTPPPLPEVPLTAPTSSAPFAEVSAPAPVAVPRYRPAAFGIFGAGVVAGGVGGYLGWLSASARTQYAATTPDSSGVVHGMTRQGAIDLSNRASSEAIAANVLFGSAAVLAAAGVVLFIVGRPGSTAGNTDGR